MNKQSFITILLTVLLGITGTKAFAEDFLFGDLVDFEYYYQFRVENETEVCLLQYHSFWDDPGPFWFNKVEVPEYVTNNGKQYKVTSIGNRAFSSFENLFSITIPSTVTSIANDAFSGCCILSEIKVNSENEKYDSRNNCNALIETSTNTLIQGSSGTVIPYDVISIIGGAFYNITYLQSIYIPSSVTSIGEKAFAGCSGLTYIQVSSENEKYDSRNGCKALIETSTNALIAGCKNTIIPNSVTSIGNSAFEGCSDLTSITIPNSVTAIGEFAFKGCSNLASVISQPKNPFDINENVFSDYSITLLAVPSGTQSAYLSKTGWKNFSNIVECENKRTIHVATAGTLPSLIKDYERYHIEELTLTGELNGTDIRFIRNMTGIDYGREGSMSDTQFWDIVTPGCLKKLDISNANIVNGGDAYYGIGRDDDNEAYYSRNNSMSYPMFYGCSSLTSITIPNSVTSIGGSVFSGCNNLVSIIVESDNLLFDSRNNCNAIIEKTSNALIAGCKNTIIPNSVTSICNSAFEGCSNLTSITIPNSVTAIGGWAFYGCGGLTSICCLNREPPTCDYSPFSWGIDKEKCIVWVPKGCVSMYKEANGWKDFSNIKEIVDGDVNLDGKADKTDVEVLAAFIMGEKPEELNEYMADVNKDESINIADIVELIKILNTGGLGTESQLDFDNVDGNLVVSSLTCTLNNERAEDIQLIKCELYCNGIWSVIRTSQVVQLQFHQEAASCVLSII